MSCPFQVYFPEYYMSFCAQIYPACLVWFSPLDNFFTLDKPVWGVMTKLDPQKHLHQSTRVLICWKGQLGCLLRRNDMVNKTAWPLVTVIILKFKLKCSITAKKQQMEHINSKIVDCKRYDCGVFWVNGLVCWYLVRL